jgi:acetoin utilization deacetylase AcuC-like enzyme
VQATHAPHFFLQRGLVRANFETPARAAALLAGCHELKLDMAVPPAVDPAALEAVHAPAYLAFLRDAPADWDKMPEHGPELVPNIHPSPEMLANGARLSPLVIGQVGWYTADTSCPITAATWPAAAAAAAGAIAAADEAAAGRHAYALARPPGHHAYPARAGGHCFLNNAAIAAERLRARGAARVAVLDIDSHHGNGTQGIFWHRRDVLTVSLHADPSAFYPFFVGYGHERGDGDGLGYNLNIPLPYGTGDAEYLIALKGAIRQIQAYAPGALVVALGLDAFEGDPLKGLAITTPGFAAIGAEIARLSLPTVFVQEGGYLSAELGENLVSALDGFEGAL